jgi:hypothetical protein
MAQNSMTPDVVMEAVETLQPFPQDLVNTNSSSKWTKERRKKERSRIHHLTKETVQAYAIEHGHKIADMSHNLFVKNLMEDGTTLYFISK